MNMKIRNPKELNSFIFLPNILLPSTSPEFRRNLRLVTSRPIPTPRSGRDGISTAMPSPVPSQGCVEPQSTLESNQRIRPVKAGQAWSNLKLFPRNNPIQHTTRISPAGNRFCTISSPIFAPSRKTHVDYQPLTKKIAPRHFVPPQTLLILVLISCRLAFSILLPKA